MTTTWIGTYPAAGLGTPAGLGEGLWRAAVAGDGAIDAAQEATVPAPSFLVAHPSLPLIYAVSEDRPTTVSVLTATPSPRVLAQVTIDGEAGCHARLSVDARTLYVALYVTGDLAVIRLGEDGLPLTEKPDQVWGHEGSGPREDRQESSHAHFVSFAPGGEHLLVSDLGTDELRRYRIGEQGLVEPEGIAATLPPGSGPRHLVARGDLLYVVCELDNQLRTLRWDRATATADVIAAQPSTLVGLREGDAVQDAHIERVAGAERDVVLVSVRGADVISVFDVWPEGELSYRAAFDTGHWPRHFAIVPAADGARVVVAAERGHHVRSFSLADVLSLPPESEAGAVAELPYHRCEVTSPACIVPQP